MTAFRASTAAGQCLDEIFAYTRETWGKDQAETYIRSLFACFERIASRDVVWRLAPAEFGIDDFYARC